MVKRDKIFEEGNVSGLPFTFNLEVSDIYHFFKSKNVYSKLETSSKSDSLEDVLVTETEDQHITKAKEVDFKTSNKLM